MLLKLQMYRILQLRNPGYIKDFSIYFSQVLNISFQLCPEFVESYKLLLN